MKKNKKEKKNNSKTQATKTIPKSDEYVTLKHENKERFVQNYHKYIYTDSPVLACVLRPSKTN